MFRADAPDHRVRLPPSGGYRGARRRPGRALPPHGTLAGRPPPAGHLSPSSSHRAAGGNDREGFRPVPVPRRRRGGVIPPDLGWTQVEAPWRRADRKSVVSGKSVSVSVELGGRRIIT